MEPTDKRTKKTTSLASAVLEDGTIVETVYRPGSHDTVFLTSKNGKIVERNEFDIPGLGRTRPFSPQNNLIAHEVILFPSCASEYGNEQALVADIRAFVHRYADLTESFEEVVSYYILLTWVYDAFNEVPYLRVKGDFGTGKSRILLTVGSLCYKPMFASGASTVSPLFRIIDTFRGTLVLDESDFRFSDEKAELVKILNNGNAAGFPVLRSEATPSKEFDPRAFVVFGPKIIASRGLFEDRALESRCITEPLVGLPPRADIPLSLPDSFQDEARAMRNRLLSFRFHHLLKPRSHISKRDPLLEPRIAQIFAPLLAVIGDDDARERVQSLARALSGTLRAERGTSVEAQLLGIIWTLDRDAIPLGIKTIAEQFASRHGEDYQRPITPRWIGAQLRKRLSLTAVKSHGTFVIPEIEKGKLEALFRRYDLGDVAGDMETSEDA
jgi:hypothetical protein